MTSIHSKKKNNGRLESILYFTRQKPGHLEHRESGKPEFVARDQLWLYDFSNPPKLFGEGSLANTYCAVSPDGKKVFFTRSKDGGRELQTVILDISTASKSAWDPTRSVQSPNRPEGSIVSAVGWSDDSDSIITIVTTLTKDSEGNRVNTLSKFQRVSLDGEEVLEETEGYRDRSRLGEPTFESNGFFTVTTRHHDTEFLDGSQDQVDIFSIEPLKKVFSTKGDRVVWSASDAPVLVRNYAGDDRLLDQNGFGLMDFSLSDIAPIFNKYGPAPSEHPNEDDVISPDGKYIVVSHYGKTIRFGILDLKESAVVQVFENVRPIYALWSPDSQRVAGLTHFSKEQVYDEAHACIFRTQSGDLMDLGFKHMRPIAWVDNETLVWMNCWGGEGCRSARSLFSCRNEPRDG